MVPDRAIVRKVKDYDPSLYFKWNTPSQYFELWRKMDNGARLLITPITMSIYRNTNPISFIQLDERILWWLYEADSWQHGGSKRLAMEQDKRFKEFTNNLNRKKLRWVRDVAKDYYNHAASFYTKKHDSKNKGRPNLNKRRNQPFIAPDVQSLSNPNVFYRSKQNALKYNWSKK